MLELDNAIRNILGDEYPVTFQYMQRDKVDIVGVYYYESSNDAKYTDGEYWYESIKIQVQFNCTGETGIQKALRYLRDFVDKIETQYCDTDDIEFVDCEHIGPKAIPIGRNEHNIMICKSVIDVKYLIKER